MTLNKVEIIGYMSYFEMLMHSKVKKHLKFHEYQQLFEF